MDILFQPLLCHLILGSIKYHDTMRRPRCCRQCCCIYLYRHESSIPADPLYIYLLWLCSNAGKGVLMEKLIRASHIGYCGLHLHSGLPSASLTTTVMPIRIPVCIFIRCNSSESEAKCAGYKL